MLKNVGHAAEAKYSLAEKNKVQIKQKEYVQQNVSHLKEETIQSYYYEKYKCWYERKIMEDINKEKWKKQVAGQKGW